MGRDGVDPSGSGLGPVVRGILRIFVALAGLAVAAFGVGLWLLRCFDYCPEDPSVDKITILLSAALLLTGLAVVIQGAFFRTQWEDVASGVLVFVGALVALTGIVSLLLLPSVDESAGARPSVVWPLAAVLVGAAIALIGVPGRRSADEGDA